MARLDIAGLKVLEASRMGMDAPESVIAIHTTDLDANFEPTLIRVAADLGLPDPLMLANVLFAESRIKPDLPPNSIGCVGINQFCPGTLEYWFNPSGADPKTITKEQQRENAERFRELSASQQLEIAGRFLRSKGTFSSARDLYWANFLPATLQKGASDETVIAASGMVYPRGLTGEKVIAANPGFLHGKDYITAGDLKQTLADVAQGARWNEIVRRVRAVQGGAPVYVPELPSARQAAMGLLTVAATVSLGYLAFVGYKNRDLIVSRAGLSAWRTRFGLG